MNQLSIENKKYLLSLSRKSIETYFEKGKYIPIEDVPEELEFSSMVFITLYNNGELRGCMGSFDHSIPICENVRNMSIAVTEDRRFRQISNEEILFLNIEISILSPLEEINTIDDVILGKHGIFIEFGSKTGTLLPKVAIEHNMNKEEFLECCFNKARITSEKEKMCSKIYIYEVDAFKES
jgi:AmmeMemoRadiSam system protein A